MASIIKNQIVKHLSKFTKNLSSDKIQLSTLKGEGELTDLELNEVVLMELMDLPTWLTLRRAVCNRVNLKIPWSKLKSQPLKVYLDEVRIEMEMTDDLRTPTDSGLPSYSSGGKYGFGDRVVDGMFLQINAVVIDFKSTAFRASVDLSRIVIQSKTPTWRTASDLSHTRISMKNKDLLLTFKEIDWQTLKIEADCMAGGAHAITTPLRLITNQSKLRIVVKKRYSDCSIVATKVQFLMDDLLWIITDSQMKAAAVFARHAKDNVDKSMEQSKTTAAKTVQNQKQASNAHRNSNTQNITQNSPASDLFLKHDIHESSYHVQTCRIDLHICDDVNVKNRSRGVDGGAIGMAIMKLSISHYPARNVGQPRKAASQHVEDLLQARDKWTDEILQTYRDQIQVDMKLGKVKLNNRTPEQITDELIERCTTVQIEDFNITTVKLDDDDSPRPPKLIMSDKKTLHLPMEMPSVYIELTEYFFPHESPIYTPCDNMYIRLNPIKIYIDTCTIVWANSFALSLSNDVEDLIKSLPIDTESTKDRVDIYAELLMPKIILSSTQPLPEYQHDRPAALQILISKLTFTNKHNVDTAHPIQSSQHHKLLSKHQSLAINDINERTQLPENGGQHPVNGYESGQFPHMNGDLELISTHHQDYVDNEVRCYTKHSNKQSPVAVDVYSVSLEQFWMEFTGVKNAGSRPVSFIESFPITLWATVPINPISDQTDDNQISVLVDIGGKICAQLNHYELCFLTQLGDSFKVMSEKLSEEQKLHQTITPTQYKLKQEEPTSSTVLTAILHIQEVQLSLLSPPTSVNQATSLSQEELGEEEPGSQTVESPPITQSTSPEPDNQTEEPEVCSNSDQTDFLPTNQSRNSSLPIVITPPVTHEDTDSGVLTMTSDNSVRFTTDFLTDVHLEKSTFYQSSSLTHRERPASVSSEKSERKSTFYNSDSPYTEPKTSKFAATFNKMTSKVKNSINKAIDDDWDNISIVSGLSDDADMLLVISQQDEEAAFSTNNNSGLNDDEESGTFNGVESRMKQLVAVTVLKIYQIEVGAQVVNDDVVAKILVGGFENEERGNMYSDIFTNQQLTDMNVYNQTPPTDRPIRVRFAAGPKAATQCPGAEEAGYAQVEVSSYSLEFLTSTLNKLGPLFKDETESKPFPVLINVSDVHLKLQDDIPSIYMTECANPPLSIHVDKLGVVRGPDGKITLQGETQPEKSKVLRRAVKHTAEKGTDTSSLEELKQEELSIVVEEQKSPTNSTMQVLAEMEHIQNENNVLKEQILRLNEKLMEKDQEDFQKSETSDQTEKQTEITELNKQIETLHTEMKFLNHRLSDQTDEIDALRQTKECLTKTIEFLEKELTEARNG